MSRGKLTPKIEELASLHFGWDDPKISKRELRLLPFIDFTMKNGQLLDIRKINHEEYEIIMKWVEECHITLDANERMTITKEFYDGMSEILWEAYIKTGDSD
jgi:superfamily I DNA and/or RNA helicase